MWYIILELDLYIQIFNDGTIWKCFSLAVMQFFLKLEHIIKFVSFWNHFLIQIILSYSCHLQVAPKKPQTNVTRCQSLVLDQKLSTFINSVKKSIMEHPGNQPSKMN